MGFNPAWELRSHNTWLDKTKEVCEWEIWDILENARKYNTVAFLWWSFHFSLWSVTHTKGYLAWLFIYSLSYYLLFNVLLVFIYVQGEYFSDFSFIVSCLHPPSGCGSKFISFLASQQILKSGRQEYLRWVQDVEETVHSFLELRMHRHHHKSALWSQSSLSHHSPTGTFTHPSGESRPSA